MLATITCTTVVKVQLKIAVIKNHANRPLLQVPKMIRLGTSTEEMAVSSLIDIESLEKSVWELLDALWSAWISDEDERGDDGTKTITFDEKMTGLCLINIYFMMTIVNASVSTTTRTMS